MYSSNRVQQGNKKFIEEVQHQTIVLPPFVDTKDQYTASMLTGDSSKIGEYKYCTLQKRFQQGNKKFIEEVQHQTIFLPPFVDTKDQLIMNSVKNQWSCSLTILSKGSK